MHWAVHKAFCLKCAIECLISTEVWKLSLLRKLGLQILQTSCVTPQINACLRGFFSEKINLDISLYLTARSQILCVAVLRTVGEMYIYTEIAEVNLSVFIYRLFHEDFSSIYGTKLLHAKQQSYYIETYDLGQKYYAPQVRPDQGSNS